MTIAQIEEAFILRCQAVALRVETGKQETYRSSFTRAVKEALDDLNLALIAARNLGGIPSGVAVFSRTERVQLRVELMQLCDLHLFSEIPTKLTRELIMRGVPDEVCEKIRSAPQRQIK